MLVSVSLVSLASVLFLLLFLIEKTESCPPNTMMRKCQMFSQVFVFSVREEYMTENGHVKTCKNPQKLLEDGM